MAFSTLTQRVTTLEQQMRAVEASLLSTSYAPPIFADGTARLNALLNSSLNISIPAGVYILTGEVTIRNGHDIAVMPGATGRVILKCDPTYGGRIITTADINYSIRGVTFDGNSMNRSAALEGDSAASLLQIVGGVNVTLDGCRFQYAPSFAVWMFRAVTPQIKTNNFVDCWHPIRHDANNLASGLIENNGITNSTSFKNIQQIECLNTLNLVIRGNKMYGAGLLAPTTHGFDGTWGNAIYIFNSTGFLIENNVSSGNLWSSCVSGQNTTQGTIRANNFADGIGTSVAIWVEQQSTSAIAVNSNVLTGGISVGDTGGDYCVISGNSITTRSVGIDCNFGARVVTINANTITSRANPKNDNGIYLWEKNTVSCSCQVVGNTINGFLVGVSINNSAAAGTVFNIDLISNTYVNCTSATHIPASIIIDPTCSGFVSG